MLFFVIGLGSTLVSRIILNLRTYSNIPEHLSLAGGIQTFKFNLNTPGGGSHYREGRSPLTGSFELPTRRSDFAAAAAAPGNRDPTGTPSGAKQYGSQYRYDHRFEGDFQNGMEHYRRREQSNALWSPPPVAYPSGVTVRTEIVTTVDEPQLGRGEERVRSARDIVYPTSSAPFGDAISGGQGARIPVITVQSGDFGRARTKDSGSES